MELSPSLREWGKLYGNTKHNVLSMLNSPGVWITLIAGYIFFAILLRKRSSISKRSLIPLPPGPRPWPIVGSMFEMSSLPHQSYAQLAKKYGPIVHVWLGHTSNVAVHTPELAMEVLKTRDMEFAYRASSVFAEHFSFGYQGMAFRQHIDATWRLLRKVCATSLFTTSSLKLSASLRQEEISEMVSAIRSAATKGGSSFVLKARPLMYEINMNMMSRMLFGKKYFGEAHSQGSEAAAFHAMMGKVVEESGRIHLGDLFPMLRWLDVQGSEKKMREEVRPALEKFYAARISERRLQHQLDGGIGEPKDFLDVLLSLKNEDRLSDICITALLSDLLSGGSNTGTVSVEWALSELITHPHQLMKAQEEIDSVVGLNRLVEESDLPRLPYLQAIMKETMRLHPPIPLLIPHYSPATSNLGGYKIPAGSSIIINAWAIGRDPDLWSSPEEFHPERFLETNMPFVGGKQYQLLAFSAGRRLCPGYSLAAIQVPHTLAALIHAFDWGPPAGQRTEDIDMVENLGMVCYRAVPLDAAVSYRLKL